MMTHPSAKFLPVTACVKCGRDFSVPNPDDQPEPFTGMCPHCGAISGYRHAKVRMAPAQR